MGHGLYPSKFAIQEPAHDPSSVLELAQDPSALTVSYAMPNALPLLQQMAQHHVHRAERVAPPLTLPIAAAGEPAYRAVHDHELKHTHAMALSVFLFLVSRTSSSNAKQSAQFPLLLFIRCPQRSSRIRPSLFPDWQCTLPEAETETETRPLSGAHT